MTDSCLFCDEDNDDCLEEHHLIPKRLWEMGWQSNRTVVLCANCHYKFHTLTDEIVEFLTDPSNKESRAPESTDSQSTGIDGLSHKIRSVINSERKPTPEKVIERLTEMGVDAATADSKLKNLMRKEVVYLTSDDKLKVSNSMWSDTIGERVSDDD